MSEPPFGPGYDPGSFGPSTPPGFAPPAQLNRPLAAPRRARTGTQRLLVVLVVLIFGGLGVSRVVASVTQRVRSEVAGTGLVEPGGPLFPSFGMSPAPRPSATAKPKPQPVPKPLRYTGTGPRTLRIGTLGEDAPSLLYVKATPAGPRPLVSAVRATGGIGATLVVTFAAYEGVTVLDRDPGSTVTRQLRIDARGPWTVEVRSSRAAPAFSGRATGRGDTVLRYTGRAGVATVTGSTHVNIRAFNPDGFLSGLTMAFQGRPTREPWEAGPLLVEVDTDGSWTIRVT